MLKVKYLELNPSSGHYGYKSHNFNVIPEKIKALVPVCSYFFGGTKPGHHAVTSFTKPALAILTWPIYFAPCLLISMNKTTKWRFLSSLFINRSFNTFRSIHCEQFKEKLSEIRGWGLYTVYKRDIIIWRSLINPIEWKM